jgi:eukaryotic-like serine/threonine-protein kinase
VPEPVEPSRPVTTPQDQPPSIASDRDETAVAAHAANVNGHRFGPSAAPDELGTLGKYRVLKQLGQGGMGAVYRAFDTRLERKVALKVMLPEFAADRAARERFVREARAAAKITHDNVVTVYEAEEHDGVPYIAMQLLQGYPLNEYLKSKGPPPLPHIIRIGREAALGLAAAHALELVHRDIKPANLWLEAPNGRVKVLDFGLAKPVGGDAELTRSGAVVGTPAYMSPEQARGRKLDHRSDLFSLGSVLYRLCTGQNPFTGPDAMAVVVALGADDPAPVRELNPNVPEALAQLIHQLLAKKPEDRPQTATEVAKRLRTILDQLLAPPPELAVPMASSADESASLPVVVHPIPVAPMHVTVQPESVFAHLGETDPSRTAPATEADRSNEPKPRRQAGGKTVLITTAATVLLAGTTVAVVVWLMNRTNDSGTDKPLEGSAAPIEKPRPEPKRPDPKDTDRSAAEWALSIGASVRVNDELKDIKLPADLPDGSFRLTGFNVPETGGSVNDTSLVNLKVCKNLTYLNLSNSPITDAGMVHFKDATALTYINLHQTRISDEGLAHLKACKKLKLIGLVRTKVTDVGLSYFKDCENLEILQLADTLVTDTGLAHLKDFRSLTRLNLSGTLMTDAGLNFLVGLTKLDRLDLRDTAVTAEGVEKLKGAAGLKPEAIVWEPALPDRIAAKWVLAACSAPGGEGVTVVVGNEAPRRLNTFFGFPQGPLRLTEVSIGGKKVIDGELARFAGCRDITALSLRYSLVGAAGLKHFKDCTGLKELNLEGCPQLTDDALDCFDGFTNLTHLNLALTPVSDAGVAHLNASKNITHLELWHTRVTGLQFFEGRTNLIHLVLHRAPVTDESLARFAGSTELTELSLGNAVIADAGLAAFKDCKKLTKLSLAYSPNMSDGGLAYFENCTNLTQLDLDGCTGTTKTGLMHFSCCKGLTRLGLADQPKLTDAGLEQFKDCKRLVYLALSNTGVTDDGLKVLTGMDRLTDLRINNTKVSAAALAKLRQALPNCKINGEPPGK